MAHFAWECLCQVGVLEMTLGPELGLHSGPVTVGVLRVFLFEGCINTAARMQL